jgi:alpha-1,4-digalacturonate transport system substrate-binding protein
MKRTFSATLSLLMVVLLIAACGSASEPTLPGEGTTAIPAAQQTSPAAETSAVAEATAAPTEAEAAATTAAATAVAGGETSGDVVELRMTWYDDGNEGEVMRDLLDRFEQENPGIKVTMDTIAYKDLHNILQAQVEGGTAPDLARITEGPRFAGQYLDMRPYMQDPDAWATNWPESRLQFLRKTDDTEGLYGFPMQYTITGVFINRTLFEQAGVEVPSDSKEEVTWQEWVDVAKQVAEATQTPYAVGMDRSGHRFWSPSLSMCADYIDDSGKFTIDTPGFRDAANMLVSWHQDRITPLEVWAGGGGGYAAANEYFVNGQLVWYLSGNWQVGQFAQQIGDKFNWDAVPTPVGECGSTGIPGGALITAFASTKHPEEVTKLVEYLTSEDVLEEFSARSLFLPAHKALIKKGIEFPSNNEELNVFLDSIPAIMPEADVLSVHPQSVTLNTTIRDRLSQVIVGEMTLDDAIARIQQTMDEAQ